MAVFEEIIDENGAYKFFYDGAWRKSSSGKSVPIINPTTRKPHFRVQGNLSFCRFFFFCKYFSWSLSSLVPLHKLIGCKNLTACTQEEVNKIIETAKLAQKSWAKTPLWKRAELLHKAAAILKEQKAPIAECLVKEIAKPAKDAVTEVSTTNNFLNNKQFFFLKKIFFICQSYFAVN